MKSSRAIHIGVLTISDRAGRGEYFDRSGKAIIDWLTRSLKSTWTPVYRVVSDDRISIKKKLKMMTDSKRCCVIFTTGGTGPSKRDITPEATLEVCTRILPGFGELMRAVSLQYVPTAILSRQTAGIRHKTLIVNLPGKPSAIKPCLDAVFPAIPDCLDVIGGPNLDVDPKKVKAYRAHRAS